MFSIVNAPAYATSNYTELFVDDVTKATESVPEVNTRFSVVGFGGTNTAFAGFGLLPWSERERSQAEIQADVQKNLDGVAGVQAFVFAPPTLPGTGGGLPVQYIIRSIGDPDQVFEVGRGDQEPRAGERPLHRRAELARLLAAAGARHHRPRPRGGARRRGQRDRHDADRAGRRRLDLEVRSREPQLRRDHAGAAGRALQSREPRRVLRAQHERRRWCRCRRSSMWSRAPRRWRSSSSTS